MQRSSGAGGHEKRGDVEVSPLIVFALHFFFDCLNDITI